MALILLYHFPVSTIRRRTDNNLSQDVKAAPPLNSKESPRNIWGLTPEDPTKFPTQMASILDRKGTLRDGDWVRLVEYLDNASLYIILTSSMLNFGVGTW